MRRLVTVLALLSSAISPTTAAPHLVVDYDFGTKAVAWKPDGKQLALQDAHGISIRDVQTLRLLRYFAFERDDVRYKPSRVLYAWCGDDLVLGRVGGVDDTDQLLPDTAFILSARSGKLLATWNGITFSPDGQMFWFKRDSRFRVLNLHHKRWFDVNLPLRTRIQSDEVGLWRPQISFSPDGRFAADQLSTGEMRLWNVATKKVTAILNQKVSSAMYPTVMAPVVWSPDGKMVATRGEDPDHADFTCDDGGPNDGSQNEHSPVVKIWNAHNGKLIQWFSSQAIPWLAPTRPVTFTWLDGHNLAVQSDGFEIRRIGTQLGSVVATRSPTALSPDRCLLFASNKLLAFNLNGHTKVLNSLPPTPSSIYRVEWSHDGRFVATDYFVQERKADNLPGKRVWDVATLIPETPTKSHDFVPNYSQGGRVYEWSFTKPVSTVNEYVGGRILAFSPGAQKVLRAGKDGVQVFDRGTNVLATLTPNINNVIGAQYSPDGTKIALARAHSVEIYAALTGRLIGKLYAWPQKTNQPDFDWLAIHPDGKITGTPPARKQVVMLP